MNATSTPNYDELVARYQEWDRDRLLSVAEAGHEDYTEPAIKAARQVLLAAQPSDQERAILQESFRKADQDRLRGTPPPKPHMPLLMKLLTAQGVFAGLMLLWVVIPGEKEVNGRTVSYGEFWASGDAMVFLLTFAAHAFCAYCFVKKIGIGRHVYLGMWVVAATLGGWLTGFGFCWEATVAGSLWSLFFYWYFFGKRNVLRYFESGLEQIDGEGLGSAGAPPSPSS